VHVLDGFSAHAGHAELLAWFGSIKGRGARPPRVVLTHGEDPAREALAAAIEERFGVVAERPGRGAVIVI
jgi:metallo-beta-lactamase family protein